jgi:Tol biopolymer transport system component
VGLGGCGGEKTVPTPPDCTGQLLVAFARQTGPDTANVYLYDLDQLGFHALPGLNSSTQADLHPSVSRDVRFIAFERQVSPANFDILFYDRCGAAIVPQPGLNTPASERDPAFSADGAHLAFVRDTLGGREVRLYNGTTFQLVPLPGITGTRPYIDADPSPNLDGTRIAFTSNRSGNDDVFVYDATGDSLLALPDLASPGSDVDPSITADGRLVMFASDRRVPGDYDLYLYDLATKSFIQLAPGVNTTSTERHPSINYDGSEIVFQSNRPGGPGGFDLYLYQRSSGQVSRIPASSPVDDVQPWIVWP